MGFLGVRMSESLFIMPSLKIFLSVYFVKFRCISFYFILYFIIQKELNKSANPVISEKS